MGPLTRRLLVCVVLTGWAVQAAPGSLLADGARPGQIYHYLHPPRYLQDINQLPRGGTRVLQIQTMRSGLWSAFTHDGQAGVSSTRQVFAVSTGYTGVRVAIKPVETPGTLPEDLYTDGNAYRVVATSIPGNRSLSLRTPVDLTLRWPRLPAGIDVFRNGSWSQVCLLAQATYTPQTISCRTSTLGTFAAVIKGPPRSHPTVLTRLADTLRAWRFVPVGIALLLGLAIIADGLRRQRLRRS
jgi:hypothetical protein